MHGLSKPVGLAAILALILSACSPRQPDGASDLEGSLTHFDGQQGIHTKARTLGAKNTGTARLTPSLGGRALHIDGPGPQ